MPEEPTSEDFTTEPAKPPTPAIGVTEPEPYSPDKSREETRGDLARGLLWLLTFAVGGILAFIGFGRLEGSVLAQSIFPSLIALTGTALGFYFGSQVAAAPKSTTSSPTLATPPPRPVDKVPPGLPTPTPPPKSTPTATPAPTPITTVTPMPTTTPTATPGPTTTPTPTSDAV
jgi:hypothetical protein